LVRYCAQEKAGFLTNKNHLGNALGLGLISTLTLGSLLSIFAQQLSLIIFKTSVYYPLFYYLAFCASLIVLYQILIALFNGLNELVKLIVCKSLASLLLLFSSLLLIKIYGLTGGLIALVTMPSLAAFFALGFITKISQFKWSWLKPCFNWHTYKDFLPYWLMSVVTLVSTPLMLILIRLHIANVDGWETAGLWEASWRIAELYLLVITTALTTYYVPKLSQAPNLTTEIKIVYEVLRWAILFASTLALGMYFCRDFLIKLLFTDHFAIVSNFLLFQLLGSVIKIIAWVFSYYLVVKQKTKLFLISEIFFGITFYLTSCYFFDQFGLIGLSYAYFINYLIY